MIKSTPTRRTALRLGTVTAAASGLVTTSGTGALAAPPPQRRWPAPVRTWVFKESTYYEGHRAIRLHRLYRAGRRFYTAHAGEAAYALENSGYEEEQPVWVIPVTDPTEAPARSVQLMRLWNERRGLQLRTISRPVAEQAMRHGYELQVEHPAPYVFTAKVTEAAAPYQFSDVWQPL
ncbi:hypothetical protein [Kineosporia babensis]|uniref:DUF5648 domain-containing protein n=1 Tax=Kineosporia babensis TaxID=499548 RepID=A0A9X1NM44_9ACTN|nr:hypothetical protein [Kineosporia babensis]MCD5316304.1 hypothetical protein [Kineosporia babensis]